MKIALVHDDLVQRGGAESVFFHLSCIFPRAHIYTSVASGYWTYRFREKKINTSFLQKLHKKLGVYRILTPLFPLAMESFNFDSYDLVISNSARYSHGIITKPKTTHISYIHSPPRQLWSHIKFSGLLTTLPLSIGRIWDFIASTRPDILLCNSKTPQSRIKKYWNRDSIILYPYVKNIFFTCKESKGSYYLIVSRLAKWKNIDIAIEACNKLNLNLKIVGDGPDKKRLEILGKSNVRFLGRINEDKLIKCYQESIALIVPQEEDFGIISLEAQACGKPVIAYAKGGVLETVIKGKTGEFFYENDSESLCSVLRSFDPGLYSRNDCINNARLFDQKTFDEKLLNIVGNLFNAKL